MPEETGEFVIGYLGPGPDQARPPETFGYGAALAYCRQLLGDGKSEKSSIVGNKSIVLRPYATHRQLCSAIVNGDSVKGQESRTFIDRAVVALENTSAGFVETVSEVERLQWTVEAQTNGLKICDEIVLPVHHYLVSKNAKIDGLKRVYSHNSAFGQCRNFVARELTARRIDTLPTASTGQAANEARKDEAVGAIVSQAAVDFGDLKIISLPSRGESSIEDYPETNATRFWVLARECSFRPTCNDRTYKTCLLLNLEVSRSGILKEALECFFPNPKQTVGSGILKTDCQSSPAIAGHAERRTPCLHVIHSTPIPNRTWEYTFLLELAGHPDQASFREAFNSLLDRGLILCPPIWLGTFANKTHNQDGSPRKLDVAAIDWRLPEGDVIRLEAEFER